MKKNLLIIKFGALGDVVRTGYILPYLSNEFNIYWLTSSASIDLIKNDTLIKSSFTEDNISHYSSINFDLVLSLDDEFDYVALLNQFSYKTIIGSYISGELVKYTDSSRLWFDMGLLSRYGKSKADFLKKKNKFSHDAILGKILGISILQPHIEIDSSFLLKWKKFFKSHTPANVKKILVNMESGERWQAKSITLNQKINFLSKLPIKLGKSFKIYIFDNNAKDNELLRDSFPNVKFIDTSESVLDYAAAIKCMDFVFTCDSLCLHLAIAQKIPNFSFFTVTSMYEINTFGSGVKIRSKSLYYCSYSKMSKSIIRVDTLLSNFLKFLRK